GSFSRQNRHRLDLKQGARTRQFRHADRGARRRRCGVEMLVANLPEVPDVFADVDNVVVDLDQMIEADAHRRERRFEVLKCQLDLFADIAAHLAGPVKAELTGKIDDAAGANHFNDMAVAWWLGDCIWIEETQVVRHGLFSLSVEDGDWLAIFLDYL